MIWLILHSESLSPFAAFRVCVLLLNLVNKETTDCGDNGTGAR